MTSWKRAGQVIAGAAMVAGFAGQDAAPAAAQQSDSVDTAAPLPRGLDFRLPPADDGRDSNVQGPSDNGLPPAPRSSAPVIPPRTSVPQSQPQPAPILTVPKAPPTVAAPRGAAPPTVAAPKAAAPATPRATPPNATTAPGTSTPPAMPVAEDLSPPVAEMPAPLSPQPTPGSGPTPEESLGGGSLADAPATSAPQAGAGDTPWWAWMLAALFAILAGLLYWRRQSVDALPDAAELRPVAEPAVPQPRPVQPTAPGAAVPVLRATPSPRHSPPPSPPQSLPRPPLPSASPAGRAVPTPAAPAAPAASDAYVTAAPLVRRPADELRADVTMDVAVRSIRIEADHVAVGFLLTLSNLGRMDATGLMVRIALGQGSTMNEAVLGRFYDGAGGSVLRDDIDLAAGRSEQLSSEVKLPRSSIEPLMMAGKPMMVPVLAADVTYHWDGTGDAFGQIAAAYVLGRAAVGGSGKLAPIPLDRAPVAVDRPAARATTVNRRQ